MKKLAFISLISLMLLGSCANAEIVRNRNFYDPNTLEAAQEEFFENGVISPQNQPQLQPEVIHSVDDYSSPIYQYTQAPLESSESKGTPLFKKYRIKITNYYRKKAYEEAQRVLQEEKLRYEKMMNSPADADIDEDELEELTGRSLKKIYEDDSENEVKVSVFEKVKNVFKRDKNKSEDKKIVDKDSKETSVGNVELSGGVKQVVAQNDVILDCDKMNYDDETQDLVATGSPVLSFPPQGVTIKADKLVYNTASNVIKAYDNVEIIKDGSPIYGDYIQINMNEETALVTNMKADKMNMLINAKNVTASEDTIVLEDGNMKGNKHYILYLRSRMLGPNLDEMLIDERDRSAISGDDGLKVKVKAEEIYVTAKKDHDIVTVKNADLYLFDNYITRFRSFTAHTNKKHEYFEANYPELGSKPRVGMFIGPGFVFDSPYGGGTFKLVPFLNYKDGIGVGGAVKYRSGTNFTEAYYGSAADIFVLKGKQYLDDRLYLQYGINSYLNDWFMGSGMSKYQVEAVYRDAVTIPNTLGEGRSATYSQRITAGYIQDSEYNRRRESINSNQMGTTRFKYMAQLSQNLYHYKDPKNLLSANLSWVFQGSAALYGTGDTQFIGRTGPMLHTQYKRWMQDIGYFLSAYDDNTPLPIFDTYRYGRSNIYARESFRVNKYLTLSWLTSATLSNDSPNKEIFQENGFYLTIGPDDLRFSLGYDFFREQTVFLFTTALDMKGTNVDYKKMVIKNPDRLARDDSEEVKLIDYYQPEPKKVKRTYAEVINIEDPNREQL